jgi:succinoglycan biosynthesis transport protein ExoP
MKNYAPPKLRQIVTEAIFRRRRIVLATVWIVLGLVLLATLLMHRKYQAQAKLMIQNVRSNAPLNTSPTETLVSQNDVSPTEVNSEVDLLQSAAVARVALDKGAGDMSANISQPEGQRQAEQVAALEHRLTVEPVHQTSLINVSLLANSPGLAEKQLQNVLDAYFQERSNAGRSSGAASFFAQQVEAKGKQLDTDTSAMSDFQVKNDIGDLDDQKKLQVQRIASLEDQLNTANATLARDQSTAAANRHQLMLTPARTASTQRTITNQYSQEHLDSELIDLLNRRAELVKRYVPTDRQIVEINEKIATTQRAITQARANPASESATDVNPVWETLTSSVATTTGDVSGLAAQRAELERQRTAAVSRLNDLETATASYDELKRRMQQSQADYQLYVQKRDEAQVAEALDKEKMFDVALVQPPMASYDPVRPKPVLYLVAGLIFALLLGTALALYADTSADQVYTPAQLDGLTGQRTLATFADEDDADGLSDRNRTEYRRVLVAMHSALRHERAEEAGNKQAFWETAETAVVVAFTSAGAGEGVTHIVDGLAGEASRQPDTKVALLDAREMLERYHAEGSVSFGLRYDDVRHCWVLAPADANNGTTRVLQGGPQGQFAARLRPLLVDARKQFDYIFFDCPSLAESTLAIELEPCVDGYVAVVGAGSARKTNVENLGETLGDARVPLLGYVLNRRRYPVPRWLHNVVWSRA